MKRLFYSKSSKIALSLALTLSTLSFSTLTANAVPTATPVMGEHSYTPPSIDFGNGQGTGLNLNVSATKTIATGTRPRCNKDTKTVDWVTPQGTTLYNYYKALSPLCITSVNWTSNVIKCVIAQDVFHFYGTKSNPYQGATLTRVYNTNWCINDQIGIRDYLPSPSDALPVHSGEPTDASLLPPGTIYNPNAPGNESNYNIYNEPYAVTDNCSTTSTVQYKTENLSAFQDKSLSSGASVKCYVGVGSPRIKTGKTCENFQTSGEQSIASAIKKNDLASLNIKNLIFQNYSALLSNTGLSGKAITSSYPAAYAAAINNLPYTTPVNKSEPALTGAEQITTMDSTPCSSIFDFIPVVSADATNLPEPKMIGTCVVPVYLPARVDKGATGRVFFDFYGSDSRNVEPYKTVVKKINVPRYLDVPFASVNATGGNEYARQLSASEAKSIYASFKATSDDTNGKYAPFSYKANTLGDLVFKDHNLGAYVGTTDESGSLTKLPTGGYFWPFNTSDTRVPYAVSEASIALSTATAGNTTSFELESMLSGPARTAANDSLSAANTASSAISAATCSGLELKPYITACADTATPGSGATPCPTVTPTPTKTPTASPSPSDSATPTPTPSATSTNPGLVDKSITNPGGDHNKRCRGAVCVKVTVAVPGSGSFTVGGTSRVADVKVSNVELLCNGRACNPSLDYDNSDPVLSTPIGQISLTGTGGFTPCTSTLAKDCDLAIQSITSPSTPILSAKVSAGFYSPTRATEATKITLPAASITVTPKVWQCVRSHTVSWGPTFDSEGNMVSPGGSATVCDQYGWVPHDELAYSIGNFELNFTDGKGAERPVSGSIGK